MTKGIAQQLRDGSKNLDQMEWEIRETARIIRENFQNYTSCHDLKGATNAFDHICKIRDLDGQNYRWMISINNTPAFGDRKYIIVCQHETNNFLIEISQREVFRSNEGRDSIPMGHIEGVHDSLDEFVSAVFEKFPLLKSNLKPLLDAGK